VDGGLRLIHPTFNWRLRKANVAWMKRSGIQVSHNQLPSSLDFTSFHPGYLLASLWLPIEHINRRCKIFHAVKEVYRDKPKNYSKTWNLVAGLVNLRYTTA